MGSRTTVLEENLRRAIQTAGELRRNARAVVVEADRLRFARIAAINPDHLSPATLRSISRESDEATHLFGLVLHLQRHLNVALGKLEKSVEGSQED